VTEYRVQSKACPGCGQVSAGTAPAGVTGRVQYGPGVHANTALLTSAGYVPIARAAGLSAALTGVKVSAGFTAGVRGRAAALLPPFMDRVRELRPRSKGEFDVVLRDGKQLKMTRNYRAAFERLVGSDI